MMICQRCLLRIARRNALVTTRRSFSNASHSQTPAILATESPIVAGDATLATTTSSVTIPSPVDQHDALVRRKGKSPSAQSRNPSSIPAGTVLKGLNFMKNKPDPVALEDSEYPDWLWTVLERNDDGKAGAAENEGDMFCEFLA